jgi:hypothetical protein
MKHLILATGLFILGCSGGESGSSAGAAPKEEATTVGEDVADTLNDVPQAEMDVEAALGEKK